MRECTIPDSFKGVETVTFVLLASEQGDMVTNVNVDDLNYVVNYAVC